MPDYRGRRRRSQDEEGYDSEGTSWIDRGPLAYEDGEESYEQPPRRYSTEDHHYRRADQPPPGEPTAQLHHPRPGGHYPPDDEPTGQVSYPPAANRYPPDDEPTGPIRHPGPDEPTGPIRYPADDEPTGRIRRPSGAGRYPADDEPTGQLPYARHDDEPTRQRPYPPAAPPPGAPRPGPPRPGPPGAAPPPGRRPPPTDADATVVMPRLRNAPQAPPTPIPQLKFNAADTTMLMSAVPYFAPSATPAYTGTIYVSYAASRAQMEGEAAARPEAEREGAAASVARSGAIMALGSIVSRLSGMLRVLVLGAALGTTVGDTYSTANTVPSMVYELLLGGILTSVLVPMLVRAREHDPDRGQAFTQRLLTLAVMTLGAATVLAVVSAPLLTMVMSSDNHGEAERSLMTSLGYLLLPEVFFFGIAGILAAVLNTRGHFAAPMWTPILNNVVVIGAAGMFLLVSDQPTLRPESMTPAQILVLGVGTTLGIAVQACGLIPALRKVGFRWRWRFDFRELHLAELGRIAGWMACYVAVSQIGVLVIIRLAYAAGSAELAGGGKAAGPWIYNNAFLLFMMAHGIVAVSIITALMPRMSAAAANHRYREVVRNISLGTRLTSVVLIPVTAAYLVLGGAITSVLFQWGRYDAASARSAGLVVAVAGLGLVPFAISQLQTFAFYALTETRTAALINIPVVATKVIVDVTLFYTLNARYVAAGLMVGNLLSYSLGAVISARMLRARLGPMGQGEVFRTLARLAIAGLVGALACAGVIQLLDTVLGTGKPFDVVRIIVGGAVLMVVYLAAAWAMRVREISDVLELVNRKLGGRLPLPRGRDRGPGPEDRDQVAAGRGRGGGRGPGTGQGPRGGRGPGGGQGPVDDRGPGAGRRPEDADGPAPTGTVYGGTPRPTRRGPERPDPRYDPRREPPPPYDPRGEPPPRRRRVEPPYQAPPPADPYRDAPPHADPYRDAPPPADPYRDGPPRDRRRPPYDPRRERPPYRDAPGHGPDRPYPDDPPYPDDRRYR